MYKKNIFLSLTEAKYYGYIQSFLKTDSLAICFTLPNIGTVKILFPEKLWASYLKNAISIWLNASQ
jgi:hypothetical protein